LSKLVNWARKTVPTVASWKPPIPSGSVKLWLDTAVVGFSVDNSNFILLRGYLLITDMFSSFAKIRLVILILLSGTTNIVGSTPLICVPAKLLGIFIFFGSEKLSVYNKKSPIIFIPVIMLLQSKFNNLGFINNIYIWSSTDESIQGVPGEFGYNGSWSSSKFLSKVTVLFVGSTETTFLLINLGSPHKVFGSILPAKTAGWRSVVKNKHFIPGYTPVVFFIAYSKSVPATPVPLGSLKPDWNTDFVWKASTKTGSTVVFPLFTSILYILSIHV